MTVSIDRLQKTSRSNSGKAAVAIMAALTVVGSATTSTAQVELKTYANEKGYVNIRTLTCAQLAGTFQEDADFLGVWYAGWFNGRSKKHMINVGRTKDGIHNVIVYCKANPSKKVIEAVQAAVSGG